MHRSAIPKKKLVHCEYFFKSSNYLYNFSTSPHPDKETQQIGINSQPQISNGTISGLA